MKRHLELNCSSCGKSLEYSRAGNTDYYTCSACNTSEYRPPETINVRIVSCSNPVSWYKDKIGQTFEVRAPKKGGSGNENASYVVVDNDPNYIKLIAKDDAVLDDAIDTEGLLDMVIALSQEVASLKRDLSMTKETIRKFAATATEADYKSGKALELIKTQGEGDY